jgi:thiosulfate/3-mercaptopyruvate sulfurtransferase
MLKAVGHEKVQVLNGGLKEALALNFPTSSHTIPNQPTSDFYQTKHWMLPTVEMEVVEKAVKNVAYKVIDVRDAKRFAGIVEPIDPIAGHIPGSTNVPFMENMDENGLYLSPEELKKKYQKILGNIYPKDCIVHCGSGITACHTLLAFAHAGMDIPRLYVGSWSEWCRSRNEIATS